jgi:acyl-[acyl-carrier-protein] desaturase
MERDREGTTVDLVYVILRFKMPGDGLVPNYHDKLLAAGLTHDSVWYVEKVVMPTLKAAGTSWEELRARSGKAERAPAST